MEQLTGEAIPRVVTRSRGVETAVETRSAANRGLWQVRSMSNMVPVGLASDPAIPGHGDSMIGIERRLVRRAEALWDSLRVGPALPSAGATAAALLRPPFASHAMLVSTSDGPARIGSGASVGEAEIGFVGQALQALVKAGNAGAAPLRARLRVLGLKAVRAGAPVRLDSDEEPLQAGGAQLLLRAIALPMAPGPDIAPCESGSAIIITSWRKLLSSDETASLHRELEAAIDWMHKLGSTTR